jgi:hypothetical protein
LSSLIPFADARTLLLAASLVPAENIHWPNSPFVEPQSSLWLSVEAYSNVLTMLDIGADKWQEQGQLMVYCCAPFGSGTDDLRTLAKNVANVFRGLPARNPFYLGASIGSGGLSEQGTYFVIPVSIEFRYED